MGNFSIEDCPACRLTQLNPMPTEAELRALYEESYFSGEEQGLGYADYRAQREEYLETFREELRRIAAHKPSGTVLDIGCGYGFFMEAAIDAGFDAYGIDVSDACIAEAQAQFPGRAFCGAIDEVPDLEGKRFDVIFASHLIEHIPNPKHFLQTLAGYLKEDGILVFVTPNIASLLARFSGSRWVSFKAPEHVAYYTPQTMQQMLKAAGYQTIEVQSAYQFYRVPFVAEKLRALFHPLSRLLPPIA